MKRKTMTENPIEKRRESRSEYVANLELQKDDEFDNSLNETLIAIARCQNVKNLKKS